MVRLQSFYTRATACFALYIIFFSCIFLSCYTATSSWITLGSKSWSSPYYCNLLDWRRRVSLNPDELQCLRMPASIQNRHLAGCAIESLTCSYIIKAYSSISTLQLHTTMQNQHLCMYNRVTHMLIYAQPRHLIRL